MTLVLIDEHEDSVIRNGENHVIVLDRLPIPEPIHPTLADPTPVAERDWETTCLDADEILRLAGDSRLPHSEWRKRRPGMRILLHYLGSFEGQSWQDRWVSSGIEDDQGWRDTIVNLWNADKGTRYDNDYPSGGVAWATAVDAIRPSYEWMQREYKLLRALPGAVIGHRDSDGQAAIVHAINTHTPREAMRVRHMRDALLQLSQILARTGKKQIADVSITDIHDVRAAAEGNRLAKPSGAAYNAMYAADMLPAGSPERFVDLTITEQRSVVELIDRTEIQSPAVRDFFIDYIRARSVGMKYASLSQLVTNLVQTFWVGIETLRPGINSFEVDPELFDEWREYIKIVRHGTNAGKPRKKTADIIILVRRLYFDINDWAQAQPDRFGHLASVNPVPPQATRARARSQRQQRAASHARTRERLPLLPALVAHVEDARRWTKAVLESARERRVGDAFQVGGVDLEVPVPKSESFGGMASGVKQGDGLVLRRLDTGEYFDAVHLETVTFWRWATLMTLKETGCRIEELEELSHASIVQYRVPDTGELLPLLQIAPSKNDKERVVLMSEELTDVIVAVLSRVRSRADNGRVPLIRRRDYGNKTLSEPMPLLFQRPINGRNRSINRAWILREMDRVAAEAGIRDEAGEIVHFQNHDFRRIYATEAAMAGFPIHILAKVLGHDDLNTTMGYAAIYGEEVLRRHRAFIEKRRRERPPSEYREPTDEEWSAFLGHFKERLLSLGSCGRAYGAKCEHEHACIRCTMLRPDPRMEIRFVEIVANLEERIDEAQREGWLGEIEGLRETLGHAREKLEQVRRKKTSLGMPSLRTVS